MVLPGGLVKSSALKSLGSPETLSWLKMYEPNLELKVTFKGGFLCFKGKKNFKVIHCGARLTKSESIIILRSSVIVVTVLPTRGRGCRGSSMSCNMKFIFFHTVQTLHGAHPNSHTMKNGFLKYPKYVSNNSSSSITEEKNARSFTSTFFSLFFPCSMIY